MAQPRVWASSGFYRRGKVRKLVQVAVVSGRGGAVLELGNLFKGGAAILADSQNGDIIVPSPKVRLCMIYLTFMHTQFCILSISPNSY
jgi:hypothetical protein